MSLWPVENTYDRELSKCVKETIQKLPTPPTFIFTQEDWAGLDLTDIGYNVLATAGEDSTEGVKIYAPSASVETYTWDRGTVNMGASFKRHYVCVQLPSGHRVLNGFFPGGRYDDDAFFEDSAKAIANRRRYLDAVLALNPDVIGGDFNACPDQDLERRTYANSDYVQQLAGGWRKSEKMLEDWIQWRHLPFQILQKQGYQLHFPSSGTAFRSGGDGGESSIAVDGFAVRKKHWSHGVDILWPNKWKQVTDHAPVFLQVELTPLRQIPPPLPQTTPAGPAMTAIFRDLSRRGLSPPAHREEVAPEPRSTLPGLLFRVTMVEDKDSLIQQELTPQPDDSREPLPITYHVYGTRPPWGNDREWGQPTMCTSWSISVLNVLRFAQKHYRNYKTLLIACPTSSSKCHDISTRRRVQSLSAPSTKPLTHIFVTRSGSEQREIPLTEAMDANLSSGPWFRQVLVHREHVKELLDENKLMFIPLRDLWNREGLWDFVATWDQDDNKKTWKILTDEDDDMKRQLLEWYPELGELVETCHRQFVESLDKVGDAKGVK